MIKNKERKKPWNGIISMNARAGSIVIDCISDGKKKPVLNSGDRLIPLLP